MASNLTIVLNKKFYFRNIGGEGKVRDNEIPTKTQWISKPSLKTIPHKITIHRLTQRTKDYHLESLSQFLELDASNTPPPVFTRKT